MNRIAALFTPEIIEALSLEIAGFVEPPLHVTRYDAPGRYLVRSEDPRKVDCHYGVDLVDPKFPRGRCSCDDYDYRLEPKIRRKRRPLRWTCKHIKAVLAELDHVRGLCVDAGLPFSPQIIPSLAQYEPANRASSAAKAAQSSRR